MNNDGMDDRFSQSSQGVYRLRKIEAMVNELKKDLYVLEEKARDARFRFEKENRDYEKLTRGSVSSIFHQALGDLDSKVEKERREALEAELYYKNVLNEIEDVNNQILTLENEKVQYFGAENEYNRLYENKLNELSRNQGAASQEIADLNRSLAQSVNNVREIDEAIAVGLEVRDCLEDALASLNKAKNWGIFDMLGGGFISGLAKHSNIDDASYAAQHAQSLLRRFKAELADVYISEDIRVDIGGFSKFADFFFDGLIADWFMQSKINATRDNFERTLRQVENVLIKLEDLKRTEERNQSGINERIEKIVVGS